MFGAKRGEAHAAVKPYQRTLITGDLIILKAENGFALIANLPNGESKAVLLKDVDDLLNMIRKVL